MTTVVDTCVLIDVLRGNTAAHHAMDSRLAAGDRIVGSVLSRTEVLAGATPSEGRRTSNLLDIVDWIPVDEQIADVAGRLANEFGRSHRGIDVVDFVIAATAQLHRADVLTRNVKHFPMFADLRKPY